MDKVVLQAFLAFLLALPVSGLQNNSPVQSALPDDSTRRFRLFEGENLLEITLRFDLSTYFRTKPKKDYLTANITFHLNESDSISKDIRLKTRGEFRNSWCPFAPIQLNFKKVDFGYSDLDSIGKLKLVTQCGTGNLNEEYLLKEYLAYKLFNVLTDTSFRVRLLKITYIDTKKKRKPIQHYGIFIEPIEMLTKRTNSFQIKSSNLTQKNIEPMVMDRLAIFNYMIGNYDWSIPGQHNVKIIKPMVLDPSGIGIAIPYDFDWSGIVDPSYAIPIEETGLESIRERLFTGICRTRETFLKDLEIFSENKDEFYRIINDFPYLSARVKRELIYYLDGFFDGMGKTNYLVDELLETCKKL
jgi:hypothetical protein